MGGVHTVFVEYQLVYYVLWVVVVVCVRVWRGWGGVVRWGQATNFLALILLSTIGVWAVAVISWTFCHISMKNNAMIVVEGLLEV